MLGPVSTPTNLYQPVQDARSPDETRATQRGPVPSGAEPYSSSATGAIAGNLNIMLLSAPERMSQNLVVLTEVLSAVLKLKQEADEPLTAFAARLIDAIATLAPAERQKLKAMLSDAFAGLQLRTLLLALRNPQGPEAATLAIYLELYRQKERDPGARAVISSYRQNGESAPAPPFRDPRTTMQPQLQPLGTVPARQPAPSLIPGQTPTITAPSNASLMGNPAPPTTSADSDVVYAAIGLPKPAETGKERDSVNLRVLRQMRERLAAAADPAHAGGTASLKTDRTQPVSANSATAGVGAPPEADLPFVASSTAKADGSSNAQAEAPNIDQEPAAGTPAFQQPSLAAAAHLLEEVAETELIRTLLALYAPDAEPDVVDLALETLMPPEPDEVEAKPQSAPATSLPEGATNELDAPVPGRSLHWEEQLALATSIPVADDGEPVRAGTRTDGLPLAFVSYIIESEDEIEPASIARKGQQEDEQRDEAEDEDDASGEDAAGDSPDKDAETEISESEESDPHDRVDLGLAAPRLDATDVAPALSPPEVDPAQALYLRLSDFA
jgi:hypothetical protein